jgi:hypothetical protein
VTTSRILSTIAALAVLSGCGGSSSPNHAASGQQFTGPLILDPSVMCVGPACRGVPMETLRLAPPAPPVIPSYPLGPVELPVLAIPALVAARPSMALDTSGFRSLSMGPPSGATAAVTAPPPPPGCTEWTVQMQVLVISTDGKEADLPAIQQALGYHTIPYTTWTATQKPGQLTPSVLSSGCAGNFQGVILTSGALSYSPDGGATWQSALSAAEWQALRTYEANFHVREISWYVFPGADQGLNPPSSSGGDPVNMTLTAAGRTVFPYLNAATPIPITNSWTYKATASDPKVTPLLVDSANNALVSSRVTSDGRETIAMTFDSNPFLVHQLVLAHGLIEWVTKGAYLGEFRAYLQPQIDDLLIDDDMYLGGTFRITANDYNKTHDWWSGQVVRPGNSGFRITMAFNGEGGSNPDIPNDPLTNAVTATAFDFYFTSHTFTHENLDNVTYAVAYAELSKNIQFAAAKGFTDFSPQGFVSPDVSGLRNKAALDAAYDNGIRFMVSDTSTESGKGTGTGLIRPPNTGVYSDLRPEILFVPRRPTNLFYNVSTPADWSAEYNAIYASFWGRNLTYQEILDKESQSLLTYMLQGELDPHMYHQPNMRAYDGTHTLLGDLLDMAFAKYRSYSMLPVISLRQEDIGSRMADTMGRNWAGVTGVVVNGTKAKFTSPQEVWFNASGVCNATAERYAGKCISNLHLPAGGSLTLTLQ